MFLFGMLETPSALAAWSFNFLPSVHLPFRSTRGAAARSIFHGARSRLKVKLHAAKADGVSC